MASKKVVAKKGKEKTDVKAQGKKRGPNGIVFAVIGIAALLIVFIAFSLLSKPAVVPKNPEETPEPSEPSCLSEGQNTTDPLSGLECCPGLEKVGFYTYPINGECDILNLTGWSCIDCGDDVCSSAENPCNCPEDCNVSCVGEGGTTYGEAPVVVPCCEGLTTISAITDSGDRIYDTAYCTKCGDGDCKSPENMYNCPADCAEAGECSENDDCTVSNSCCGVPECHPKGSAPEYMCDNIGCSEPAYEDYTFVWPNTFCRCVNNACAERVRWETACTQMCNASTTPAGCLAPSPYGLSLWGEHCAAITCGCINGTSELSVEEFNALKEAGLDEGYYRLSAYVVFKYDTCPMLANGRPNEGCIYPHVVVSDKAVKKTDYFRGDPLANYELYLSAKNTTLLKGLGPVNKYSFVLRVEKGDPDGYIVSYEAG